MSSDEVSFEAFCATSLVQQKRSGLELTSTHPNSFSYRQWRIAARRYFKRTRIGDDSAVPESFGDEVSVPIASRMMQSLAAMPTSQTPFPMPTDSTTSVVALLSAFEVAVRLALAFPNDASLWGQILRMRVDIDKLFDGSVGILAENAYPALHLLVDFLSLYFIFLLFDTLPETAQADTLRCGAEICERLESSAATTCSEEQHHACDSGVVNVTTLQATVIAAMKTVPYEFPAVCHEVLAVVLPNVVEPQGKLRLLAAPRAVSVASSATACSSDEDCLVGELLATPRLSAGVQHLAAKPKAAPQPIRRTVSVTNTLRHMQCASNYHGFYADREKHASKECRFCASCHLMEVIFNSCKADCLWKHWPTERKIRLHLKRFPEVMRLALERFSLMQKEGVLPPFKELPR